jgi:hypothetical protein
MPLNLELTDDFSTILDGGEAVTLKRRESAVAIEVPRAWRESARAVEAEPAGGHVSRGDVVWQFAWDEANERPRLGDLIIDAAGECFTVLVVEHFGVTGRVRCETRNLRIVYQLTDRVDVQFAVIEDSGGGPEIVGWTTVRSAVPARVQPEAMEVDATTDPATAESRYRIILGEQLELAANTRFVEGAGRVYSLVSYEQAERVDVLPVAVVLRVE